MSAVNKYAIVSGSSSGLGLACCESLLDRDYRVFGFSRRNTPNPHPNLVDIGVDITNPHQMDEAFQVIDSEADEIDVVVNAAGICEFSPLAELSTEDLNRHWQTNVVGTFNLMKRLEPFLAEKKTRIISILSQAAKQAFKESGAYTTSKFALLGLLKTFELEWAHYSVKFSNLFPGAIATPLWEQAFAKEEGVSIPKNQMMGLEDFMALFELILDRGDSVQLQELCFSHPSGSLDL